LFRPIWQFSRNETKNRPILPSPDGGGGVTRLFVLDGPGCEKLNEINNLIEKKESNAAQKLAKMNLWLRLLSRS